MPLTYMRAMPGAVANLGYLPPALKGDHLAVEFTGELDEANAQSLEAVGAVGATLIVSRNK